MANGKDLRVSDISRLKQFEAGNIQKPIKPYKKKPIPKEAFIGFDRSDLPEDARILTYEEVKDMCIQVYNELHPNKNG